MSLHAIARAERAKRDAERKAAEDAEREAQYRRSQAVGAQKQAERDRQAAEAKAAADRAYAIEYAAMSPMQREIVDYCRERAARDAAEKAAPKAATPTKTRHEMTVPIYYPPSPVDPTNADGLEARARDLARRAEAEPSEANRYQALVAGREAAKVRAFSRLEAETKAADLAVQDAVRQAGYDPVARAKAKAAAVSARATRLGEAELAYEAASLEYDRALVETAKASKLIAHRIESRKAAILADEAKALNDPQALGNPYYRPPVSLAMWQFDALDAAAKRRAIDDGVRVYSDEPPAFTADEAKSILRARGSSARSVVTRAELAEMSPDDQAKAARSAIIAD